MEPSKRTHLLLLDQASDGPGLMEDYLDKAGFAVESYSGITSAWTAFLSAPPQALLLDIPSDSRSAEDFLKRLRNHSSGAQLPVLIMSTYWKPHDPKILNLVREHSLHIFLPRPFALLDLPDHLRKAIRNPPRKTASTSGRPDRKSFSLLLGVWRDQRTGVLRLNQAENWALFVHGAPVDGQALSLATRGLYEGGILFSHTSQDGQGEMGPFARLLWKGALSLASRTFVLRGDRLVIKHTDLVARIAEFCPSEFTLQCLGEGNAQKRLDSLIEEAGAQGDELCLELGALKVLGLVEFQEVAPRQAQQPRKTRPTPAPAPAVEAPPQSVVAPSESVPEPKPEKPRPPPTPVMAPVVSEVPPGEAVLRRLKREHKALKNADHYTILGVDPKASQEMIETFSERMKTRYQEILEDPTNSPEILFLAGDIKRWVDNAADLLAKQNSRPRDEVDMTGYADASTEDQAFREGQTAMEAGLYTRATQCFTRARNERLDSARNLAWLGWATYHDQNLDLAERTDEALEFLRLASTFDPHHKEGQYYLAFIEGKNGMAPQAIKRLKGLLLEDKDNSVAQTLLSKLRTGQSK